MKRLYSLTAVFAFCLSLSAVNYCAPSSWGNAGSVTGGGNATPVSVSTENALKNALKNNNAVVIITKDITVTSQVAIEGKSNITLMALPGKRLISTSQEKTTSGILAIKNGCSNIILRNLTFEGPGSYDCDGRDNLAVTSSQNIWVDHCDFQDGLDGNFDINSTTDNITVSWCRFRYLKAPKAGGPGGSDDHRFSNLIGSDSDDKPSDGTYNITYAFCWWDEGCKQRMTRCRHSELHFLNCYWNSSVADYYIGPENSSCYFEGCTFAGRANSPSGIWSPFKAKIDGVSYPSVNYCKFVNCEGNLPSDAEPVATPSYSYDQLSPKEAVKYITNRTKGSGATLTVTESGEVSEGEEPPLANVFWNISDSKFNTIDSVDLAGGKTVDGLTIKGPGMKIEGNKKSIDGYDFTYRLKTGGKSNNTERYLTFDVAKTCTITFYCMSGKSNTVRNIKVIAGSDPETLSAGDGTAITKVTYDYVGDATGIRVETPDGSVSFYGIKITYPGVPTGCENIADQAPKALKIMLDGKVYILREGVKYDILGNRVQ